MSGDFRRVSLLNRMAQRKSVIAETQQLFERWRGKMGADPLEVTHSAERSTLWAALRAFVNSQGFNATVMCVIFANAVTIAIEANAPGKQQKAGYAVLNRCFLLFYIVECTLKIADSPLGYWKSRYNVFDFVIVAASVISLGAVGLANAGVLQVLRTFRALRVLRSISFIRSLRVIVGTLVKTIGSILNLISLLLILMYVFAVVGYYLYGYDSVEGDVRYWGSLDRCMISLFTLVTADGWMDIQERLEDRGHTSSRAFTTLFLFFGHFVFTNLFIGIVIQNLEEATVEEKARDEVKRRALFQHKKQFILQRQRIAHGDWSDILRSTPDGELALLFREHTQRASRDSSLSLRATLFDVRWLRQYMTMLDGQEGTRARIQGLHRDVMRRLQRGGHTNQPSWPARDNPANPDHGHN